MSQPNDDRFAPWFPPTHDERTTRAFRALKEGKASQSEQGLVVRFIQNQLCDVGGLSYRPNSQRDTDFAEGKRFVGLQIEKLMNFPMENFENE